MVREKIRIALDSSGYSRREFGALIGVNAPNLNAFLTGSRTLPYPSLVKALDELELTIGPRKSGASIYPPREMPEIFRQAIDHGGWKTKDVAEGTGIDPSCLSLFLSGTRSAPIRNIEKLMDFLDLDMVRLIKPKKVIPA